MRGSSYAVDDDRDEGYERNQRHGGSLVGKLDTTEQAEGRTCVSHGA